MGAAAAVVRAKKERVPTKQAMIKLVFEKRESVLGKNIDINKSA